MQGRKPGGAHTGLSAICAEQRLTLAAVSWSADEGDSAAVKLARHIQNGKATAVKIIAETQQDSSPASRDISQSGNREGLGRPCPVKH